MAVDVPILVTGAAGRVGGVGGAVVKTLRQRDLPVRALVRREDERAEALRATGAEVVVGDLTRAGDVARALAGCRRLYFGMSVSRRVKKLQCIFSPGFIGPLLPALCLDFPLAMPHTHSHRKPHERRWGNLWIGSNY
jgi:NAD(P)-dependent dehydrogenase (short-subunit alcohol dehydrogenase family)